MVDLDHLDTLDDDAPPSPDLGHVRSRARWLRTRNRLAAIGTGIAVLAVAVGVVAVVHNRDDRVQVLGPSGATAPDLSAHLELPQSTYPAGYSLEGSIVFDNRQGEPIDYTISCAKERPWTVLLSKDGVVFEIARATGACIGPGTTAALAPGISRVPFYVGLTYSGCGMQPEGPAFPACTGDPPGIPDLAPGRYQMVFRGSGAPFKSLDVAPLTIEVVARG